MMLHVLDYWDVKTDFMVGAQLEGFDVMTQIEDDCDFVYLREMNIFLLLLIGVQNFSFINPILL